MEGTMNALLKTAPEPDAMQYVEDFPIPQIKEDEVLLEIKAAGICGTDHSLYRWNEAIANSYNIQWPAIFCHEFSGVIAEVGPKAPQNLKPGMHVTANPILYDDTCEWCDRGMVNICDNRPFYGTDLPGAFAKYMAIRGINVIPMPESIPFTQAALMEPLCVAMNAVLSASIRKSATPASSWAPVLSACSWSPCSSRLAASARLSSPASMPMRSASPSPRSSVPSA